MGEMDAGMPVYIVAAVVAGLLVCMALLMATARYGSAHGPASDEYD